jgi:hypothetical protein
MQPAAPRFLFVPVSGPGGAGEYYRSLAIARGLEQRWPGCRIRFVLNRSAPYATDAPFPGLLIDDSPTRANAVVAEFIASERPDIVVFDSSGRLAQYRAAHAAGAGVIYVSSRPKTRWKGFRLRRMRALDQHWIAHPRFLGGELSAYERCKLRLVGGPEVIFLEALHEPVDAAGTHGLQERLGLEPGKYVLLCPGGGGTFGDGTDPSRVFLGAAQRLSDTRDVPVVAVVGQRLHGEITPSELRPRLRILPGLPNGVLLGMIRDATVAAVNGGSLLLQSMAQGVPLVAAPIAGDQLERIRHCANDGYVRQVALDRDALAEGLGLLLDDALARGRLRERLARLALRNGVDTAADAVARLLQRVNMHKEVQG